MKCPRGCAQPLNPQAQAGLQIDCCPACEGVWLDTGEGELLTKPKDPPPEVVQELVTLDPPEVRDANPPLNCPRCSQVMGQERFAHSQVQIDRCGCGVWLDKGELEKIQAWRTSTLSDLQRRYGPNGYPPEELERAFSRVYFDVGTPRV